MGISPLDFWFGARQLGMLMGTLPPQKGQVILRKEIDFEHVEEYSFVVDANDGRKNDSATVNVSLININGAVHISHVLPIR